MLLKFVGTGDAAGVPVYGCTCEICLKAKEKSRYRRKPCSLLLEEGSERILIDAGLPDLADRFPVGSLSRIFLTHYHVDHLQGLFHLRWGCNTKIPVHGPDDPEGCGDLFKHPGILDFSPVMKPFIEQTFGTLSIIPVPLIHSKTTLGYCIASNQNRLAYLCDTAGLPEKTLTFLQQWQPDLIILDCTHPPQTSNSQNHNDYNMVLSIAEKLKNIDFILSHISHTFDQWLLEHRSSLPDNIHVARDEMAWEV